MSDLLVPGGYVPAGPSGHGPFDRDFFAAQFKAGQAPACHLYGQGEVPVVVLELTNGMVCDVCAFEAFKRDYLVAQVFVDPPDCDELYLSFVRYETVFRVNVRYYHAPDRRIGFKPGHEPEVEPDPEPGADAPQETGL